jgi:hypothetical protein
MSVRALAHSYLQKIDGLGTYRDDIRHTWAHEARQPETEQTQAKAARSRDTAGGASSPALDCLID